MGKQTTKKTDQINNRGEDKVPEEEVEEVSSENESEETNMEKEAEISEANSDQESGDSTIPQDENIGESDADQQDLAEEDDDSEEEEEVDPLTDLQNKLKGQEDKYIRVLAELENFKRRNQQETRNKLKFAGQALAQDIIPGLDNLERAIEHAKEEDNEQLTEFIKGVEMAQQNFYDAFSKNNIERQYPEKEVFNPNHHEAVGVVQTDDIQPEHIAQVFQAGYIMHDRVIRPAMVQVAKKK
ncbi:MAG: nucleotide exchange factor GrpE [Proteobacteria bacterium]|nr:nucleotide exchange factor GrpE [Pseudomonadota bacterium]